MTISIKELKSKFNRIQDLQSSSFNIPRFRYLEKDLFRKNREEYQKIESWISQSIKANNQIFNIRTFNFNDFSSKETISSPHLTDISSSEIFSKLGEINKSYDCLIDTEIPDNGRISGNVIIYSNHKTNPNYDLEFVIKEKRAMVRDIDSDSKIYSFSSPLQSHPFLNQIPSISSLSKEQINQILLHILYKAFSFYKKDVILEFTFFSIPSGILSYTSSSFPESYIVWWEYRKSE